MSGFVSRGAELHVEVPEGECWGSGEQNRRKPECPVEEINTFSIILNLVSTQISLCL